jgi:protein-disulfide isomerase
MKRLLATTSLIVATLSAPVHAFDLTAMTDAERAAFGAEVRAYLIANPQVIMESVQQMEAQQADQAAQDDLALVSTNAEAIFNDGYSWIGGNPDGDITVVEFLDYRCGYCRKAHYEVAALLKDDGNIKLIVKEFPISGDEAYKSAHDAMITFGGDPSEKALKRLADGLGLDGDAIIAHMDSDDVTKEIAQTRALAQRLNVRGTPTFVMGGQLVRGYVPLDTMEQIIKEERG